MNNNEEPDHDFGPRLRKYLESKFNTRIDPGPVRASVILPSGTILYVRESKELKDANREYGYYHLVKRNYDEIIKNPNSYFAIVYDNPENTFVFTGTTVKEVFENEKLIYPPNSPPKWHFKIVKSDGKYNLDFNRIDSPKKDVTQYLNNWDQIEDFKGKEREDRVRMVRGIEDKNPSTKWLCVTDEEAGKNVWNTGASEQAIVALRR